jgi:hypothetical protein
MPIGLLYLLRWRQRVASVRQRTGWIRCSIYMPHIRPRKGRRHPGHVGYVGCGEWQGEQDPRGSRAQSPPTAGGGPIGASLAALLGADPILLLWLGGGLKVASSGREPTHHTHYETSVRIYVRTVLAGLSAHKKLLDVSRRRAGSCPAPSRGICWSRDERSIRLSEEQVCAPEQ